MSTLDLPPELIGKARLNGAEQWLAGLPDLLASLERDWSIRVGASYPGSTEALVTQATLADGAPAALKLCLPYQGETPGHQVAREAHDDERAVLVHGDVHHGNALEAGDGTFKLVDPDGLLAEPEYELSVIMREDPVDLMTGDPRERARWLARRCGLDATRIWEWGVVERVSTGLVCTQIDLQPVGRQMLAAADHIAAHHADR